MFLLNGTVVYSPTDLALATQCEYGMLRRLDAKLHRAGLVDVEDPLMDRAALLGDAHEQRVLTGYLAAFGSQEPGRVGGVAVLAEQVDYHSEEALRRAAQRTLDALRADADVVYQGAFFDGRFFGRSDFLERRGTRYVVLDTKLARHAKVPALLQLAGYAEQLQLQGVPLDFHVGLILGDRTRREYAVADLLTVYRRRRARLGWLLDEHLSDDGPADWGDARWSACGRCSECAAEAAQRRDVLLVAGLRLSQRVRLRAAGITSIEDLASSTGAVAGIGASTLDRLRHQGRLQSAQDQRPQLPNGLPHVTAEVVDEAPLLGLPSPDPGDLFFDFEGDPLWDCGDGKFGLEYLIGVVENDTGAFRPFVAHDRAQEGQAFKQFLDYVRQRRAQHPCMRIYHYASYERSALARLAARHAIGEDVVDDMFRHGVLVDLYSVVRAAVRVSQPSYSIKKLEPLYMGEHHRDGVDNAADSVVEYAKFTELRAAGNDDEAAQVLSGILGYNEYDCVSTRELRSWLRSLVAQSESSALTPLSDDAIPLSPIADPLADHLRERAVELGEGHPGAVPHRMLAAAVGYHAREDKPAWWEHFRRLREPIEDWCDGRDVFQIDDVLSAGSWEKPSPRSNPCRRLVLAGTWGAGSVPGSTALPVFDSPIPNGLMPPKDGCRATGPESTITAASDLPPDAAGRDLVILHLKLKKDQSEYDELPVALVPTGPINSDNPRAALRELGESVLAHGLGEQPGLSLLRRQTADDGLPALPEVVDYDAGTAVIDAVTAALKARKNSYVAVQGPPGTGKTHLGAHVVAALVADGWKVGVVAQSHAVIGNFLDAAIRAGLPVDLAAKRDSGPKGAWSARDPSKFAAFLDANPDGCLLGGTVWDFAHTGRVQREQLDLLVVDEAGQYALANTLAASVSAQRLLLLGDPQQLPQVSQGTHPEPVDGSALGWLMEGTAILPADRGYFLATSRRMDPALCAKVSILSYEGQLRSHKPSTSGRLLAGFDPGLHVVPVEHVGNAVSSPEEAAEAVVQIHRLLGLPWTASPTSAPCSLQETDLLVVAAYNAQVNEIRKQLVAAGLAGVLVGTVDKLQGRQAVAAIVSLSASSPADVPRGMDFLLSRNRLNVAVSRAQWATVLLHAPALADFLPATPEGLLQLGAYLELIAKDNCRSEMAVGGRAESSR